MAQRYCKSCDGWHDLAEPWPSACLPKRDYKRASVAAPMIICDGLEVKSMVDGKVYTSKAALRASYRQAGVIEVGNEVQKPPPRVKPDREAIRNSIRRGMSLAGIPV